MNKQIYIFALGAVGQGISGSDRIFIEFARRWSRKIPTSIYVSQEGREMCRRQKLESPVRFEVQGQKSYLTRILEGIMLGLILKPHDNAIIYSASEFWMDCLPAFLLKIRFPKIKWAAAWYQTAPNPVKGFSESNNGGRSRLRALIYWLMQLPVKPLIAKAADFVLVNNDIEKNQFPNLNREGRAIVVFGAVDLKKIMFFKTKFKNQKKIYDAVFQGRFHPQKGVLELVDIWKTVASKKPDAKLVIIGDGPLMEEVREKIKKEKLKENIKLTGYLFDGHDKYKIFAQSRVVVHPAFYDSGGMASAEAMAFGLPCVGFNLKSYESYYPKGMIKVESGNKDKFAEAVLDLLSDAAKYKKVALEAVEMINKNWSWDDRASEVLNLVVK